MAERKQAYFAKLLNLLDTYQKVLIVGCDNVGSNQMQSIRTGLRGKAEILMGKNTMMRKAIKGHTAKNTKLDALLPYLKGNIGLIFTNSDLKEVRDYIDSNKKTAPARVGSLSPCDVYVTAMVTTLDPSFTGFMQALNIGTRINKGCIEIISDIHLIKPGEKVTSSQAALLEKLNIQPFKYGLIAEHIYDDGEVYPPKVLELTNAEILKKVTSGVQRVAALSLQTSFPTLVSIPHLIGRAYQDLCAISIASDYTFEGVAKLKELLDNPEALAAATAAAAAATPVAAATPAASAPVAAAKAPAAKEAPKEEEKEEEEEGEGGFGGLFD